MKSKIALFGGTFDPIHCGHTCVAEEVAEQLGASEVVFVPTKRSPHKKIFPIADSESRMSMIRLAISGVSNFRVSDCELRRPDPSYTLDTVRSFRVEYGPGADFYWLLGADMVKDLGQWHKIRTLLAECNICVMLRGGVTSPRFEPLESALGRAGVEKLARNMITTPLVDISSSEIRRKLACGADIEGMVDPKVLNYIKENRLYEQ